MKVRGLDSGQSYSRFALTDAEYDSFVRFLVFDDRRRQSAGDVVAQQALEETVVQKTEGVAVPQTTGFEEVTHTVEAVAQSPGEVTVVREPHDDAVVQEFDGATSARDAGAEDARDDGTGDVWEDGAKDVEDAGAEEPLDTITVDVHDGEDEQGMLEARVSAGGTDACVALARLVSASDPARAIGLCERAMEQSDADEAAYLLSQLVRESDPARSKELLEGVVAAGIWYDAANDLGLMVEEEDPERAAGLFRMAIAHGSIGAAAENMAELMRTRLGRPEGAVAYYKMALSSMAEPSSRLLAGYGFLLMFRNPDKARDLLRRAMETEEGVASARNLAHLLLFDDPSEAETLYRRVIGHGSDPGLTGAYVNLSLLLKERDAAQAGELLRFAKTRRDFPEAVESLASVYEDAYPEHAERLRELVRAASASAVLRPRIEQFLCYNARYIGICTIVARLDNHYPPEFGAEFLLPSSQGLTKNLWRVLQTEGGSEAAWSAPDASRSLEGAHTTREFMRYIVEMGKDAFTSEPHGRGTYDRSFTD